VSLREKLAFRDEEVEPTLKRLLDLPSLREALILSTCNRVEIHGVSAPSLTMNACAEVRDFLIHSRDVNRTKIAGTLFEIQGVEAARHMFRVASALDSLVLGETQILGQMKAAYGLSVRSGSAGPILQRCAERAFHTAKRVRSETRIGEGAANISSVAVELASHVFGELTGKSVLIVGAGKMSALAVRHLRANGASTIYVVNRSFDRAETLADEVGGVPRPWEQREKLLELADVVITSTASTEPIFLKKPIAKIMKKRRYRSLVIIDIAVPRDVDESVGRIDSVYLFDIDDLEKIVASNLKERKHESETAESIVTSEVVDFQKWLHSQKVVPTIRSLRDHFSSVAKTEVEKVIKNLRVKESEEEREAAIRRLGDLIVNKLLHTPMVALKDDSAGEVEELISAAERLFRLSSEKENNSTEGSND